MIFKKTAMQGNYVLANGNLIIFKDGLYETESENEIEQLSPVYAEASAEEAIAETAPAETKTESEPAVTTGMRSSVSLKDLVN